MGRVIWFYDPGQETGWAAGLDGELFGCGLVRVYKDRPLSISGGTPILQTKAWIEIPEFRREKNEVDPNDLIALGTKVGRIQERCLTWGYEVFLVRPSYWKGSVPKKIHHQRIRADLRPSETVVLETGLAPVAEGLQHNVLDAVGGFLWASKKEGLR